VWERSRFVRRALRREQETEAPPCGIQVYLWWHSKLGGSHHVLKMWVW